MVAPEAAEAVLGSPVSAPKALLPEPGHLRVVMGVGIGEMVKSWLMSG